MKKIDKEKEQKIIQEYKEGYSMKNIGDKYNISNTTVFNVLKRNNIVSRTNGGIYHLDETLILALYKEGKSSQEIANKFNVCCHTITNILDKNGVKRNNIYHNINLNEEYWHKIDTYDKAYFLGFLLTDGNVCGNGIRLSLSEKDKNILEVFRNKTNNENPIKTNKRGMSSFSVKRRQWVNDLSQYGVIPNKTQTVKLPLIDNSLMSHLIRGLIDGDGWISSKAHQIGLCGTCELVTSVRNLLVKELGVYVVKVLHTQPHLWQISWSSRNDINKICSYMYKGKKDCFLERKFIEYQNIIHVNTEINQEIAE